MPPPSAVRGDPFGGKTQMQLVLQLLPYLMRYGLAVPAFCIGNLAAWVVCLVLVRPAGIGRWSLTAGTDLVALGLFLVALKHVRLAVAERRALILQNRSSWSGSDLAAEVKLLASEPALD